MYHILTHPPASNYGGILQAYALQRALVGLDYDADIVDYTSRLQIAMRPKGGRARLFSLLKLISAILGIGKRPVPSPYVSWFHRLFKKRFMRLFPLNDSRSNLSRLCDKAAFIVGSDQVWRPCYSPCIADYFLKDVPSSADVLKIAYAASFGTDQWEFSDEETSEYSKLAKLFDFISVREKSGVRLCHEFLSVDAQHVLDPTMLLGAQDYIHLIENANIPESTSNLFCYILDPNSESEKIIKSLERDGYKVTYAMLTANPTKSNPRPCQMSVEEWLRGIYSAELVVTDSFHACVFSIIFKKPFVALGNPQRGNTRFDSLLETFGLRGRLILNYSSFVENNALLKTSCDLLELDSILQELRQQSLMLLTNLVSINPNA